jgi:hypothetical protein
MSIQAISWAFKQKLDSSPLKFILICFANYANEHGFTWCSNEQLVHMSCMNEKTVKKWVKKLEDDGFLIDTGKRQGATGRIKIYKIVSFETQPNLASLDSRPNQANSGQVIRPIQGSNQANLGKPLTIPYIDKPKDTKETINTKSKKLSLAQWEEKQGAKLSSKMMMNWVKANNFDLAKIDSAIGDFRLRVTASGNPFVCFVAAFQNWFNRGFLTIKPAQAKTQKQNDGVVIFDKGLTI